MREEVIVLPSFTLRVRLDAQRTPQAKLKRT